MRTRKIMLLAGIAFGFLINPVKAGEPFTQMERTHIRVQTPGLFAKGNKFEIRLDTLSDDAFRFPLEGGKLISGYGSRRGHAGSDIKTHAHDTICSVFDGVVRMSRHYAAYGKVVVVRHANGLETVYSHNSKNLVEVGDTVRAGQPVGLTGRTGRATTEHLHFEIRVNGQHFNPSLLFNMQTRQPLKRVLICTRVGNHIKLTPKK